MYLTCQHLVAGETGLAKKRYLIDSQTGTSFIRISELIFAVNSDTEAA
jgi:hypothetical protein